MQATRFNDSLAVRGEQLRFRNIGNPYAFLNSVSIGPILEKIYKGANIVDVAQDLNLAIGILLTWLEEEGHMAQVENACTFSAEGYLSEAGRLLRDAKNDFDLKKAKEIASHGRFMASKMDKAKYGTDSAKGGSGTAVQFVMYMGDKKQELTIAANDNTPPMDIEGIPGSFSIMPRLAAPPKDVAPPDTDSVGPFEPEPFKPEAATLPRHLAQLNALGMD